MDKAVVLNQQFSGVVAPSPSSHFAHHIALLTSKTDGQRRDSLNHITAAIVLSVKNGSTLPQPTRAMVPKVLPLAHDASEGIRGQVLRFLQALPPQDLVENIEDIARYLRLGLTHLAISIRSSAADALGHVLTVGGEDFVSCRGGWIQTLKCLVAVLGWTESKSKDGWTTKPISKASLDAKVTAKYLRLLIAMMEVGLKPPKASLAPTKSWFPFHQVDRHMIPRWSNPYGDLNLFGHTGGEDEQGYEDFEERQEIFDKRFRSTVIKGLGNARLEGGDIGRAAVKAVEVMNAGMAGFEAGGR